jgi:hypothetical protein
MQWVSYRKLNVDSDHPSIACIHAVLFAPPDPSRSIMHCTLYVHVSTVCIHLQFFKNIVCKCFKRAGAADKVEKIMCRRVDHKTLPFRSCCYYFLFFYRDPALLPHQVPSVLSYVSGILSGYINWIFTSLPPSRLIRHLPLGFSSQTRITYK